MKLLLLSPMFFLDESVNLLCNIRQKKYCADQEHHMIRRNSQGYKLIRSTDSIASFQDAE